MAANLEFERVNELHGLRGFTNLFHKENRSWWGTRRWWVNALLWTGMLGGLVSLMLFMLPGVASATGDPQVAAAGGPIPFGLMMGRTVFFELGTMALAVGAIVLCQDLIVEEKQSGLAEWLLAKPVARRSYVLAKLAASMLAVLALLVAIPALVTYALLSIRTGTFYPMLPFLAGAGIMALHTLFYLSLTLMLGTIFNSRAPILGIGLASVLGGAMIAGFLQPLLYVTPWILGKYAGMVAGSQQIPAGMLWTPLAATILWSLLFILVALFKFERTEF